VDRSSLLARLNAYVDELRREFFDASDSDLFTAWFMLACAAVDKADTAMAALTDGPNDRNLDAVHFDHDAETLYLVQSKYRTRVKSTAEQEKDVLAFVDVARRLYTEDVSQFNEFVDGLREDLRPVMMKAREALLEKTYRLQMLYVTTGHFSEKVSNSASTLFRKHAGQERAALGRIDGERLAAVADDYEIGVAGLVEDVEVGAVHGSMSSFQDGRTGISSWVFAAKAEDVAAMYDRFSIRLFDRNVRGYMGETRGSVNEQIRHSAEHEPELFSYYNNGVTIVSEDVSVGAGNVVKISGPQVVNGQQTTRSLAKSASVEDARVLVRVFKIPRDLDFDGITYRDVIGHIVRATNSQTKIDAGDLISNDRRQVELEREMRKRGYLYLRKSMKASEVRKLTYSYLSRRVKRDDLTRAVAACRHEARAVQIGMNRLYAEEYESIFDGASADLYLVHHRLGEVARKLTRGKNDEKRAVPVALHHFWLSHKRILEKLPGRFISAFEDGDNTIVASTTREIEVNLEAALRLYRDRAKAARRERRELQMQNYFRKKGGVRGELRRFWPELPKYLRDKHEKAAKRLEADLKSG
jgi:hypothetical protein